MTQGAVRVLIVEDDLPTRQILMEILQEEGYVVDVASHGLEALERARRDVPQVVLLDWNLPFMDGPSFVLALRQLDGGQRTRIILVSASSRVPERAEHLGADGYLEKPFDLDRLLTLVSAAAAG